MRDATVCFLRKDNRALLALIEYAPGNRKWNGIGGFIEQSETPKAAVIREAKEEIGIQIEPEDLTELKTVPLKDTSLHIFSANRWTGNPYIIDKTLKELRWFNTNEIPYDQMHQDNDKWLPDLLK